MAESSVAEPPFILRCGHAKVINVRKTKYCKDVEVAFTKDWYIPGLAVVRHGCQKDCHEASGGNILATFCKLTDVDSNNIVLLFGSNCGFFKEQIPMKGNLSASLPNVELTDKEKQSRRHEDLKAIFTQYFQIKLEFNIEDTSEVFVNHHCLQKPNGGATSIIALRIFPENSGGITKVFNAASGNILPFKHMVLPSLRALNRDLGEPTSLVYVNFKAKKKTYSGSFWEVVCAEKSLRTLCDRYVSLPKEHELLSCRIGISTVVFHPNVTDMSDILKTRKGFVFNFESGRKKVLFMEST